MRIVFDYKSQPRLFWVTLTMLVAALAYVVWSSTSMLGPDMYALTIGALIFFLTILIDTADIREVHDAPVCVECGYPHDAEASPEHCPECGAGLRYTDAVSVSRPWRPRERNALRWITGAVLAMGILILWEMMG